MAENTATIEKAVSAGTIEKRDPKVRRVVTGHDKDGKSIVWKDGFATNHKYPNPRMISTLLWCGTEVPIDFLGDEDMGNRILGTAPPPGGFRFMFSELGPGDKAEPAPHPHRTDSMDFMVTLSGEVTMILDKEKVILKPGDICIGRATNHAWFNHGTVPWRAVAMLVDGKPKREGSVSGMQQQTEK